MAKRKVKVPGLFSQDVTDADRVATVSAMARFAMATPQDYTFRYGSGTRGGQVRSVSLDTRRFVKVKIGRGWVVAWDYNAPAKSGCGLGDYRHCYVSDMHEV